MEAEIAISSPKAMSSEQGGRTRFLATRAQRFREMPFLRSAGYHAYARVGMRLTKSAWTEIVRFTPFRRRVRSKYVAEAKVVRPPGMQWTNTTNLGRVTIDSVSSVAPDG